MGTDRGLISGSTETEEPKPEPEKGTEHQDMEQDGSETGQGTGRQNPEAGGETDVDMSGATGKPDAPEGELTAEAMDALEELFPGEEQGKDAAGKLHATHMQREAEPTGLPTGTDRRGPASAEMEGDPQGARWLASRRQMEQRWPAPRRHREVRQGQQRTRKCG